MINNVLRIRELREEMFGDVTEAEVPEQQQEEVHQKCHENEQCVEKAMQQMKEDLMKVRVLVVIDVDLD